MADLAIIGGTGLTQLDSLEIKSREIMHTPYGEPSGPVTHGKLQGKNIIFLPRHGYGHTIPPHKINYRANIYAIKDTGVKKVFAVAAVGGIRDDLNASEIVIPDQIIDYSWSRVNSFFEEGLKQVVHIDFTHPYTESLRKIIIQAARNANVKVFDGATYGATQGPRLETAAEIDRLERDGCHIVGMTGMPEACLAREVGLDYATCAVVANRAAGRGDGEITMRDIELKLAAGMANVGKVLEHLVQLV